VAQSSAAPVSLFVLTSDVTILALPVLALVGFFKTESKTQGSWLVMLAFSLLLLAIFPSNGPWISFSVKGPFWSLPLNMMSARIFYIAAIVLCMLLPLRNTKTAYGVEFSPLKATCFIILPILAGFVLSSVTWSTLPHFNEPAIEGPVGK